jgi:hypothetical protein
MSNSALSVVQKWHNALNSAQVDEMIALVHPQVEIGGPRGSARGSQVVREWFGRANVRLLPLRWFDGGNQIVVEELGEWLSPETGQVTGSQQVATVFQVNDEGLITRIVRHDALAAALEDVCLLLEDEVSPDEIG